MRSLVIAALVAAAALPGCTSQKERETTEVREGESMATAVGRVMCGNQDERIFGLSIVAELAADSKELGADEQARVHDMASERVRQGCADYKPMADRSRPNR